MESATVPVDLTDGDALLAVDISDALSEVDKVKFTVHTRTSMPRFAKGEFSVIRLHEEFVWLHDTFADNAEYGGYVIPPPPPRYCIHSFFLQRNAHLEMSFILGRISMLRERSCGN